MDLLNEQRKRDLALSYTPPKGSIPTLALRQQLFNQNDSDRNFRLNESAVTERYMSQDQEDLLRNIANARKSNADISGLREQWQLKGYDPKTIADGISLDEMFNRARVGSRTAQGLQRDFSNKLNLDQFDRSKFENDRNYNRGVFENNRSFGLQSQNAARQQANDELSRKMDIWQMTGIAPEGIEGVAAGTQLYNKNNPNVTADYNPQKMNDEKAGMMEALRSGKMNPAQAVQQIQEDVSLGFYTPQEGQELMSILGSMGAQYVPPQQANQDQLATLPSSKDLDQLWKSDPSGKSAGAPLYDWKNWYSSPQGRLGNISFDAWHRVYGPKLG